MISGAFCPELCSSTGVQTLVLRKVLEGKIGKRMEIQWKKWLKCIPSTHVQNHLQIKEAVRLANSATQQVVTLTRECNYIILYYIILYIIYIIHKYVITENWCESVWPPCCNRSGHRTNFGLTVLEILQPFSSYGTQRAKSQLLFPTQTLNISWKRLRSQRWMFGRTCQN